jgi:hypothetical protein
MTRARKSIVQLIAAAPVELEPGIVMKAGTYTGEMKQLGLPTMGGQISWTAPEYKIEFDAQQLSHMGMVNVGNLMSIEYDVTKFVRSGQIKVA